MVNWAKLDAEREAAQSLIEFYDQAKRCQQLHEAAGMPVPEPIKRLLGMSEEGAKKTHRSEGVITAPIHARPPEATDGWVSIAASEASVSSVALAILRKNGNMRPRDLNEAVLDVLPNATAGSVANMGTRLQGTVINRAEEGWKIIDQKAAGIIIDDRLWALPSALSVQDLATHRREAILHILKEYPTGLQTVQIVEQLRKCSWVHAPVNKDLLKADMEVLQTAGRVRRRGNSKKWEVVREDRP